MTSRFVVCTGLILLISASGATEDKVSRPFEYSGYTAAAYKSHTTQVAYVPMRDGVKIAVDIFLPTDGPDRVSFPVVLAYTPYQRAKINPETGAASDITRSHSSKGLLAHGYALVSADMRGTGASTGWLLDFMPAIWEDGKEVVDWIAAQPWCDGHVGMSGGSYLGWSQTATASHAPEALKCIMPTVIPLEGYTGEVYPGGIYLQGFLSTWAGFMFPVQRNYFQPDMGFLPTRPALDEDGDGDLADEIPRDQDGSGTFLDDGYPPKYADGAERNHVYYDASKEHEKNYDYSSWAKDAFFIDGKSPLDYTLYDLGPNAHVKGMMASGIPIYNVGGWFDGFARGTFELFETLKASNPSKVLMFPGYHGVLGGPYWEYAGADQSAARDMMLAEELRFYDRYLKGIENGIDAEPPIWMYVMHGGWRAEAAWPPARAKQRTLYLANDHSLQVEGTEGADDYRADFSHNSSYGTNGGNRWLGIAGNEPDALPIRTEKDNQCLVYNSEALESAMEVVGHPIVHLWVSSDTPDADFFVYLEDVEPGGEVVLVTEAQLRGGFAALHDNDEIIYSGKQGIDVKPELPWHGYEKDEYNPEIFADGAVIELVIDFQPTAYVFRAEHRIRVSIACADFPTFRLHEKLAPNNTPDDPANMVPTITVHRGSAYPSSIELPVIP